MFTSLLIMRNKKEIKELSKIIPKNIKKYNFLIKYPELRPVNASADIMEIKNVVEVNVHLRHDINLRILHDADDNMEDRHLREQFLVE